MSDYEHCDSSNVDKIIINFLELDTKYYLPNRCIKECDPDCALKLISICPDAYIYLPDKLRRNKKFANKAIELNVKILKLHFQEYLLYFKNNNNHYYINNDEEDEDEELNYNYDLENNNVWTESDLLEENYDFEIINFINNDKIDFDFIKCAIDNIISKKFLYDKYFMLWLFYIIRKNSKATKYFSDFMKITEISYMIIKRYSSAFTFISEELKVNKNYIIEIININGMVLKYLNNR